MPSRHDATALLRQRCSLEEISHRLREPIGKVIQDLRLQAGEGEIRLSEIFFAISPDKRDRLEALIQQAGTSSPGKLQKLPEARGFEWHELDLYCRLRDPSIFRGDLYEYLADTEVALHRSVREVLIAEFGPDERQWWRQGIPLAIRTKCAEIQQVDENPVGDLFAYTTLIQLSEIIDRNWKIFQPRLPSQLANDKKRLLREFARLNSLRNAVMHPVKGLKWEREDFEFVREWHRHFVAARSS
jgi:hypothetical protein